MEVTSEAIAEVVNDRQRVRDYLLSLPLDETIDVMSSCSCVYHGYLFSLFPEAHFIEILMESMCVWPSDGTKVIAYVGGTFPEAIQYAFESRWVEKGRRGLYPWECIEALDGMMDWKEGDPIDE